MQTKDGGLNSQQQGWRNQTALRNISEEESNKFFININVSSIKLRLHYQLMFNCQETRICMFPQTSKV